MAKEQRKGSGQSLTLDLKSTHLAVVARPPSSSLACGRPAEPWARRRSTSGPPSTHGTGRQHGAARRRSAPSQGSAHAGERARGGAVFSFSGGMDEIAAVAASLARVRRERRERERMVRVRVFPPRERGFLFRRDRRCAVGWRGRLRSRRRVPRATFGPGGRGFSRPRPRLRARALGREEREPSDENPTADGSRGGTEGRGCASLRPLDVNPTAKMNWAEAG